MESDRDRYWRVAKVLGDEDDLSCTSFVVDPEWIFLACPGRRQGQGKKNGNRD
jgi:hypothetical protein